jgi:tetratricopeptide (TPR) repeat protein
MHRFTTQALILVALTATSGCSSNSLFGKRRVDLDSTYTDSTAIAEYPAGDKRASTDAEAIPAVLAAANYESAPKLIERATRLAESALPNENTKLFESRALFQKALEQKPGDPTIHHQLAILSDKLKDFSEAERHYNAAIAKRPKDANVLSDFGYSYFLQKQYKQAEQKLTAALEADPDHAHAAVNLGAVHGALGNYDEAVSWFRRGGSEAETQRNLAEFFPQGRSTATNIAGNSTNNANPFEGMPPEIQPERLIPDNRQQEEMAARLRQTAQAANTNTAALPVINPGSSSAPNLQAPAASNPFETGFAASPSPQNQAFQPQPNRPAQSAQSQPANPFADNQPAIPVLAAGTQSAYNNQAAGSLPMWPHSPNRQSQSAPTGPAPTVTIQPGATSLATNQLPTIHPGQPGSGQNPFPNTVGHPTNSMQQMANGIQQTAGQLPQVDRNAQFVGMNAGPGTIFPVQGNAQSQAGAFNAQVNQLQQNARNLIPQPAQNFNQNTATTVDQLAENTVNDFTQHGTQSMNQIPQAQYPDINPATNMRTTLGNIVDQYQQQASQTGQPTRQQRQQSQQFNNALPNSGQAVNNYGGQLNEAAQHATNPFADEQLPQIFPGAPGGSR